MHSGEGSETREVPGDTADILDAMMSAAKLLLH